MELFDNLPLYFDAVDAGGVGGGSDANPTGGSDASATQTSDPIALSDDTLIRVGGSDKPVKFSDHVRGFQSQFTKASQEAARLKNELAAERQARTQLEQAQRQASQQVQRGQNVDPYQALKALPYLSGNEAAAVVENIASQIRQRDLILLGTLQQMQQMQEIVQRLNGNHVQTSWESKIQKVLADGGYPKEALDFAKEVYLAYEGDDLDDEFPELFKTRWNQLQGIIKAQQEAAVKAARQGQFNLPGRGGNGSPSQPIKLDPKASPAEIAAQLWPALQGGDET